MPKIVLDIFVKYINFKISVIFENENSTIFLLNLKKYTLYIGSNVPVFENRKKCYITPP